MAKSDSTIKAQSSDARSEIKLSEEQMKSLREEADRYRQAQRQIVEAFGVLWNAQLDISIAEGDPASIRRALTRPVEFYDNCNCGGTTTSSW
jgi:hypothetical protein